MTNIHVSLSNMVASLDCTNVVYFKGVFMKSKYLVLTVLLASIQAFAASNKAPVGVAQAAKQGNEKVNEVKNMKLNVDTKTSEIVWLGKKVTGEHTGKISIKSGHFNGPSDMSTFTGQIEIDMNSITCTDIESAEYNKKLVDHLKSDEFFATSKHKTAVLKIKRLVISHTFAPGAPNVEVEGVITVKGKNKDVKFPAMFEPNAKDSSFTFSGKLTLDRTDFDVRYGSGKFFEGLGDKMIYDPFDLTFKIVAKK